MPYKAVIFDLDGTLVYTAPEFRYAIVGQTLRDLGLSAQKEDIDRFWFGADRNKLIESRFKVSPPRFWGTYNQYDLPDLRSKHMKVYSDFDFVRELIKKNYRTGIVTGAPGNIVELYLEKMSGVNFHAIITANTINGVREKPDPHGIEFCLEILRIEKGEAVYVGNGDEDIAAAKSAGVFDVLVDRGEHGFLNMEPSLRISSLYELRDLLGV